MRQMTHERTRDLHDLHNFIDLNAEQLKDVFSGKFSGNVSIENAPDPIRKFLLKKDPRIDSVRMGPLLNGNKYYRWWIGGFLRLPKGTVIGNFNAKCDIDAMVYEGSIHTRGLDALVPPNQRQW